MPLNLKSLELNFVGEIRDPVFGYVYVTNFEAPVLDSPIFQRLNRIFQMPTAHIVYPSAKHTRKVHSLGAAHLAHKAILNILFRQHEGISSQISPIFWGERVVIKPKKEKGLDNLSQPLREKWWNDKKIDEIVQSVRLAGMLHDIGHPPFSHLFEDICTLLKIEMEFNGKKGVFNHELMSRKIIAEKAKELCLLKPFGVDHINQILDLRGIAPPFLRELIDSGYDCDKLDYLVRDALGTGAVEFGLIDCERILNGLRVKDENLCISVSALDALIESFDAVQYMYTSVYYHRTARIFDFMMSDALSRMREFLSGIVSSTDEFLKYDDFNFIIRAKEYLKSENNKESKEALEILDDFQFRRKKYEEVFSHRISSIFLLEDTLAGVLQELEKELQQLAKSLEIRVDYRPQIKPIGIDLQQIPTWLIQDRIFDPETGGVKPLKHFSRAYHDRLTKYTILFRIYANRHQLKDDPTNVFANEKAKIVNLAAKRLDELEKKIEM